MTRPDNSEIIHHDGGTTIVGQSAMRLLHAAHVKTAISLHKKTGLIPTRGVTITKLFQMATAITQKPYKRGEHDKAVADLQVWIDTMRAALPITDERTKKEG